MESPEYQDRLAIDQELLRLTFCGIIIASFFAALSANHSLKTFLSPSGTIAGTTVLGLSAAFGFAYLVSVASALKYQGPRQVDRFPLSVKASKFFYDSSVNIFGIYILVLLVEWVGSKWLHLPERIWVWPVYLVLFSATYVVARFAWALAQYGIEWQYDYSNKREEQIKTFRKGKSHGRNNNSND